MRGYVAEENIPTPTYFCFSRLGTTPRFSRLPSRTNREKVFTTEVEYGNRDSIRGSEHKIVAGELLGVLQTLLLEKNTAINPMMMFSCALAALCSITFASPIDLSTKPYPLFNNVTIFTPPSAWANHQTSYARTAYLEHKAEGKNSLLASWTFSPPSRPYAPIYQSQDGGLTWDELSKAYFPSADKNKSIILQVFLYELPHDLGTYPAGTVLLAANAIPANRSSTNIELLVSHDRG
jgi:hypothetical protein